MHRRGRIYWLTWALLVLGAAATGVASIQDAFFRGAVAAFLAPLALPLYERAGPRAAAFLGLGTGILWQLFLTYGYGALVWSDELRAYAMSRFEIDLSVSAAAFAGAALTAAMVHRDQRFVRAATVGTVLALAMTALPYGFIRSSEAVRMGPVEVTWLMPLEDIGEDGRPVRPKGVEVPTISAADREALREAFLTIDVAGETALVDTEGRRLWAVWRKRLHQPGHEDGPVRRVFVAWRERTEERTIMFHRIGDLSLALPSSPEGFCVVEHRDDSIKILAGDAHLLTDQPPFGSDQPNWFSRIANSLSGFDPTQPNGRHADVFLFIRFYDTDDNHWTSWRALTHDHWETGRKLSRLWVLRRGSLETAREACDRLVPRSDRVTLMEDFLAWPQKHSLRSLIKTRTLTLPDVPAPIQQAHEDPLDKVPLTPAEPAPAAK